MSNVLIGIIGVILFIGLALAGALFLGPRFQQATNSSRASAMVQGVGQIAQALNLRMIQSGEYIGDNQRQIMPDDVLVAEGYLKAVPTNPYAGQPIMLFYDPTGADPASVVGNRSYFVEMFMSADDQAADVCAAVQKQTSGSTTIPTLRPMARTGCFKDPNGQYRVYARV